MRNARDRPREVARPYFTRQAQSGRRVIFSWRPADTSPDNPLTTPWLNADELIEGVEFADELAARCFDLDRAVGESVRPPGGAGGAGRPDQPGACPAGATLASDRNGVLRRMPYQLTHD